MIISDKGGGVPKFRKVLCPIPPSSFSNPRLMTNIKYKTPKLGTKWVKRNDDGRVKGVEKGKLTDCGGFIARLVQFASRFRPVNMRLAIVSGGCCWMRLAEWQHFEVACPVVCCRGTDSKGWVQWRWQDFGQVLHSRDSVGTLQRQLEAGHPPEVGSVEDTWAGRRQDFRLPAAVGSY